MNRKDYILHVDTMRRGLIELMNWSKGDYERLGKFADAEPIEDDRAKKTAKMFDDLATRLYEDSAVSEKVRVEKLSRGEYEQTEMPLGGGEE